MDRCVPKVIEDGTADGPDQAVAICSSMWEEAKRGAIMTDVKEVRSRAYSILEVRQVDAEKMEMVGMATTPTPDRMGDVVEPMGLKFKNPLPLLLHHRSDHPVGLARFGKPTPDGVPFTARLASVSGDGALAKRIEEAWQSIKAGLIRGVSIGFRALEVSVMKDGGLHFLRAEVLELSLVTIPANTDTSIEVIKSIDASLRAASGNVQRVEIKEAASGQGSESPGVTGITTTTSRRKTPMETNMPAKQMTVSEQITAFENSRAAKVAQMEDLMSKAAEEGATLQEEESTTYDELDEDVKKIDQHLKRLAGMSERNKQLAKPVADEKQINAAQELIDRSPQNRDRVVSVKANVPPGMAFVRVLIAKYQAREQGVPAWEIYKQHPHWHNTPEVEMYLRAPVAVGNTSTSGWASQLVELQNLPGEFAELLRATTILGRLPGLRRVPFNVKVPRQTSGSTVNWVGEGRVKPVSALAFDQITLTHTKIAGIVPITEELLRFSSPSAEEIIRNDLRDEITEFMDRQLLDPTVAAATGVNPASLTNGVTAVPASGATADAFRTDLNNLLNNFTAAGIGLAGIVLVMTEQQALAISMMVNTLGQDEFPAISATGGNIRGIPVITSENIVSTDGSPANGSLIIAIATREVLLADDGGVNIDVSREASLQMDSAPDSPAVAATVLVSLWQHNMVAIKAERFVNWLKRRAEAVQYISYAKYAP